MRCMGVGERWGWSLGKGHGRRTCGCADPVRFLPPRPAGVQPPLQPLGILAQPLRHLVRVRARAGVTGRVRARARVGVGIGVGVIGLGLGLGLGLALGLGLGW